MKDPFEDQITIKMEPELRHALAHIYYAVEALAHNRPISALDNLRSIESLIMFDGDEDDWETYYRNRLNLLDQLERSQKWQQSVKERSVKERSVKGNQLPKSAKARNKK